MKKASLIVALVLAGCASMGQHEWWDGHRHHIAKSQPPKDRKSEYCYEAPCKVKVTVTMNGSVCVVSADPFALVMGGEPGQPFRPAVIWQISGGTFDAQRGIEFEPKAVGVFSQTQGNTHTYVFANGGTRGVYHYTVRAVDPNGHACDPLDPTGINDM